MTDVSNAKFGSITGKRIGTSKQRFAVVETFWGYIVRPTNGPKLMLQVKQAGAMIIGAGFLSSAMGLLLFPDAMYGGTEFLFRAGIAVIFAGIAFMLLWYASRGSQVEYHIDTSQGEIRETVVNRTGRSTRLGTYGFDAIGGVFIDRAGADSQNASLALRFGNTSQTVVVAQGSAAQLGQLKDRLGQDLIIG